MVRINRLVYHLFSPRCQLRHRNQNNISSCSFPLLSPLSFLLSACHFLIFRSIFLHFLSLFALPSLLFLFFPLVFFVVLLLLFLTVFVFDPVLPSFVPFPPPSLISPPCSSESWKSCHPKKTNRGISFSSSASFPILFSLVRALQFFLFSVCVVLLSSSLVSLCYIRPSFSPALFSSSSNSSLCLQLKAESHRQSEQMKKSEAVRGHG